MHFSSCNEINKTVKKFLIAVNSDVKTSFMKGKDMKFDVIIKDLTEQEFATLQQKLSGVTALDVLIPQTTVAQVLAPAVAESEDEAGSTASDGAGVDSQGLPWDARIHSSSKKKKADGSWNRRKNLSDEEFERVKKELLGQTPVAPASPQPVMTPPPAIVPVTVAPSVPFAPVPTVNVAPPAPVAPAPLPPPAPAATRDFNSLMSRIQKNFQAGKIDMNSINGLLVEINGMTGSQLTQITDVASNQQLVDIAHNVMDSKGY